MKSMEGVKTPENREEKKWKDKYEVLKKKYKLLRKVSL
jgi:hypothetical protein